MVCLDFLYFRFPLHRLITQLISLEIEFPLINYVIRRCLFARINPCHYNRKFASFEASPPLRGYNFRFPLHRLITQLISLEIEFPLINCVIIRCLYAKNPSASLRTITTDVTSTVNSLQAALRHMKAST